MHAKKFNKLYTERKASMKRFVEAHRLQTRMLQFGPPQDIKDMIYRHAFEEPWDHVEAERMCVQYEMGEPLVILHLAVWKAACILKVSEDQGDTRMVNHFLRGGWDSSKADCRWDPLIHGVMTCVGEFLGMFNQFQN
jgi:hypothetical protein